MSEPLHQQDSAPGDHKPGVQSGEGTNHAERDFTGKGRHISLDRIPGKLMEFPRNWSNGMETSKERMPARTLQDAESEIFQLTEANAKLREDNAALSACIAEQAEELSQRQEEIAALQKESAELQKEKASLEGKYQKELRAKEDEAKALHARVSKQQEVIEELQRNSEQLARDDQTATWVEREDKRRSLVGETDRQALAPLILPKEAPIKWSDRKTFVVSDIKDDLVRRKLQETPELVAKLRALEPKDGALTFLDIIYSEYIAAGLGQRELRGGKGCPPLDERLFKLCSDQCLAEGKPLREVLATVSHRVDAELSVADLRKFNELARLKSAEARRRKKYNDLC